LKVFSNVDLIAPIRENYTTIAYRDIRRKQ